MSRSGYSDDLDQNQMAMWRGQVASATRGKRGQRLLRDTLAALDAMPVKELVSGDLVTADGCCCTLGACGIYRKVEGLDKLDPEEHDILAEKFDVAACLIQEIEWWNDDKDETWTARGWAQETDAERWVRMRAWVAKRIKDTEPATTAP